MVHNGTRSGSLVQDDRRNRSASGVGDPGRCGVDPAGFQLSAYEAPVSCIGQYSRPAAYMSQLTENFQGVRGIAATPDYSLAASYLIIFTRIAVDRVNDVQSCIPYSQDPRLHTGRLRGMAPLSTVLSFAESGRDGTTPGGIPYLARTTRKPRLSRRVSWSYCARLALRRLSTGLL